MKTNFYVKVESAEQAKEVIDLLVRAGYNKCEGVKGIHTANDGFKELLDWKKRPYVGVDEDEDTILSSNGDYFDVFNTGKELLLEELPNFLGLVSESAWYDYKTRKAISPPPVDAEVQYPWLDGGSVTYIVRSAPVKTEKHTRVIVQDQNSLSSTSSGLLNLIYTDLRPLDWDKEPEVKVVDLNWLVGMQIDCTFRSHRTDRDAYGMLTGISPDTEENNLYQREGKEKRWACVQPRENHTHIMTKEALDRVPEEFETRTVLIYSAGVFSGYYLVDFLGLKENCIYPWEKK